MPTIPGSTQVQSRYVQDQRVTDQLDGTFLVDARGGTFTVSRNDEDNAWEARPLARRGNLLVMYGDADDAIAFLIGEPR